MKRLIFTVIAAVSFGAAVSAREYASGSSRASGPGTTGAQAVIETVDQSQLALETIEKLTPGADPAAPNVKFTVRSVYAAGEMMGDSALKDITAWQVQILDSSGKKVSFLQGKAQPMPPILSWSGLAENGEPFPSGFYTARLVWMEHSNKVYATQKVSFNLFTQLKMPEFAELKLDLRFIERFTLI